VTVAGEQLLIVLHSSSLRALGEAEALAALGADDHHLPRAVVALDMRRFDEEVEGGYWKESHAYIRRVASDIRRAADEARDARIQYFGLAEIPHVVALGAYVGDERRVEVHDYDRDRDSWTWPAAAQTLHVETLGLPHEPVAQPGPVVVRVAISNAIADADVDAVVPPERLADIQIRPSGGRDPARGMVRSGQDVDAVRAEFRNALAAIAATRPSADVVHLFVAAPVSVCFVIGQELHLRSGKNVQTYRFRVREGDRSYQPAIVLTAGGVREVDTPLTPEEVQLARELRLTVWPDVLRSVIEYAQHRRAEVAEGARWYDHLRPPAIIEPLEPWPGLAPVWDVVNPRHAVSPEPRESDYGLDKDNNVWQLSDRLLVRLHAAANGDGARLRELIRLFFFHEYLHDWQVLTKYTAEDVGSFANCLERIDYIADAYAILHQLDFMSREHSKRVVDDDARKAIVAGQIDLALRSFWAFEEPPPSYEWQERRLRRYLNWYLRRVQIRRARDLPTALQLLVRHPTIEVAGLRYTTGRGRIFVRLNEVRVGEALEVGVALEDGRFWRSGNVGNLRIDETLEAFARHNHDAVGLFFNSLYEFVSATGGHLPPA